MIDDAVVADKFEQLMVEDESFNAAIDELESYTLKTCGFDLANS